MGRRAVRRSVERARGLRDDSYVSVRETVGHHMAAGSVKREQNGQFPKGENGGHHGAPGRSGRLPSDVRELCRELIDKHNLMTQLAALATSAERDSDKIAAMKLLMTYGFGQPTQVVEHTGKDGGPIEYIEHAKTDFQSRMDRITARLGAAGMPEGIE